MKEIFIILLLLIHQTLMDLHHHHVVPCLEDELTNILHLYELQNYDPQNEQQNESQNSSFNLEKPCIKAVQSHYGSLI